MATFLFRCPNTGLNAQGFAASDPADEDVAFESVTCNACTRTHFANPKSGKVLGANDEE